MQYNVMTGPLIENKRYNSNTFKMQTIHELLISNRLMHHELSAKAIDCNY